MVNKSPFEDMLVTGHACLEKKTVGLFMTTEEKNEVNENDKNMNDKMFEKVLNMMEKMSERIVQMENKNN